MSKKTPSSGTQVKTRGMNPKVKHAWLDFSFVVPAIVLLAIFTYYPIAEVIRISFTNWDLLKPDYDYVGFKNYKWLLTGTGGKYFMNSLKVTLIYTVGEITITVVGGILFALLFNRPGSKGYTFMRVLTFTPRYIAMSSAAVVFLWLYDETYGIFNYFLGLIGAEPIRWLQDKYMAMVSILLLTGWRAIGYGMMIYLANMRSIPETYYEAAALDGANGRQKFFKITVPLLGPTTVFLLVTTFISSMKVFQSVDVLTGGGPSRATEVLVYLVYNYAMNKFRMDQACTIALALFAFLLLVTVATMKISDNKVNYDA